jgi:hypothetical protein
MPGELSEPLTPRASALAASELAVVSQEDEPPGLGHGHDERGHGGVAVVLAVAAIVAAIVGARASFIASQASEHWQSSLRTEVKRSAAAVNDIQSLYEDELPAAMPILRARLIEQAMQTAAASQTGAAQQALELEASAQAAFISEVAANSPLASKPVYALPSGGFDLAQRLANLRSKRPEFLALNPDVLQADGDRLSNKAELLTYSLIPISICAFLAVLAQPFGRRRRLLLTFGLFALAIGIAMAVGVEVLA